MPLAAANSSTPGRQAASVPVVMTAVAPVSRASSRASSLAPPTWPETKLTAKRPAKVQHGHGRVARLVLQVRGNGAHGDARGRHEHMPPVLAEHAGHVRGQPAKGATPSRPAASRAGA
jgi:hypothetical protein